MSDFDFLSPCACVFIYLCKYARVCGLSLCVFMPVVSVPPAGGTEHGPFLLNLHTPLHTTHNQSHD